MLLSHYTGRVGLEGIARSKSLWATRFTELNDKREMEYGFVALMSRAFRAALDEVNERLTLQERRPVDYADAEKKIAEGFRAMFEGDCGHEPLYVFSFATGKTEDHNKRGHLTLWDRYTRSEGYCLQFESADIRQILELEATRRNYGLLDLVPVQYGIDESSPDFRELLFQITQRLLAFIDHHKSGLALQVEYDKLWPDPTVGLRMLNFYSRHKDPFFEDERETRIMAVPAKQADSRVLTGPALRKQVKSMADGRHYIGIGEDWRPGLEPRRIIVGPRASADLGDILRLFERKVEVSTVNFPV